MADTVALCKRGGVINAVLHQALKSVIDKCSTCRSTGRPLKSRKVSFGKILSSFSLNVQVDFLFISEMENDPTLHIVDVHAAYSVTVLMESRDMNAVAHEFDDDWCQVHGLPSRVSGGQEFNNNIFKKFFDYYRIEFQDRSARRQSKLGVVERKNAIRLYSQLILKDAEYVLASRGVEITHAELLSRATFLSNVIYGEKKLSSFEMVRGYTPSLAVSGIARDR